jgi:hypothetical protein
MSIRIGRCFYSHGKRIDPTFPGFTPILVLSKSASEWGALSPYELKDEYGRIHENIYQFAKIYTQTNTVTEKYPLNQYGKIIWQWPSEEHIVKTIDGRSIVSEKYAIWRQKGLYVNKPVRYPNGKQGTKDCVCAFKEISPILPSDTPSQVLYKLSPPLNYIESRKQIYAQEYFRLVRQESKYQELNERLTNGENLLIIEVDGPHQESLEYYRNTYGVDTDFINKNTMLATKENLKIMLNDQKHPFGHAYCLAISLQNLEDMLLN